MWCFNEAAGIPRGRQPRHVGEVVESVASMRPRVFPAEDRLTTTRRRPMFVSFNEAAGIPRGRPEPEPESEPEPEDASMRPRVFPAEDKQRDFTNLTNLTLQ